jgi:hypothetical protein
MVLTRSLADKLDAFSLTYNLTKKRWKLYIFGTHLAERHHLAWRVSHL